MKDSQSKPLISIITVCLNSVKELEDTILSVINQTYHNVEYIIIDGGSTDGTLDIINKYKKDISYWVSEKDNGIYDAMNKGISFTKGDIINFLNAGDLYYDNKILELVSEAYLTNGLPDLIYGLSYCYSLDAGINYFSGGKIKDSVLWKGMPICHQSIFFKKDLFNILGNFDISFKASADYEWLLKFKRNISNNNYKEYFLDLPLSKFKLYGQSSSQYFKNLNEIESVSKKYYSLNFSKRLYFSLKKIKYIFLKILIITKLIYLYKKIKYNIVYKISFNLKNKKKVH